MSIKLLRNREAFNRILKYDVLIGPIGELPSSQIPNEKICKLGCYIKHQEKYYGVYSTTEGPCFFYQNDRFLLEDVSSEFYHEKGLKQHRFKFTYHDDVIIDLNYDHWDDLDIDPWSEEDFIDFFIWLTTSSNNKAFIEMWTE